MHVRVLGGLTLEVNVIAALKPFRADRVMVDDPAAPALTVTLVGFAVIVKSWTV